MKNKPNKQRSLSACQRKMAEGMAKGMTAVAAYTKAGYTGNPLKNACRITKSYGFHAYYEGLQAKRKTRAVASRRKKEAKQKVDEEAKEKHEGNLRVAQILLQPELIASSTIRALTPSAPETEEEYTTIPAIWEELKALTNGVADGGTCHLERVAATQITTLHHLFNHMVHLGLENLRNPHYEKMLKLGLKAQSQCARTIETLATLKNPSIIAKQLNMAHQQVVNNAPFTATPAQEPSGSEPPSEAPMALTQRDSEIVPFAQMKSPAPATHALD